MPRFLLCLLLALSPAGIFAETAPKVEATPEKLPTAQSPLPWHMVNLWWTMPATDNFESLEIDFSISDDVDSSKLNLYIAPIGLGQINGVNFYGGIQTNIGGYPVSDASPQGDYHKGKGAIFSRWGNKDLDTSFVRPALDGLTEAAGYEGDFASGRRPFAWHGGKYTYAVRKLNYEKDADGREWTWVGAFVTEQATQKTQFITALKFPGRTLKFWGRHSAFIEIYGGKKVVIADLPKLEIRFGAPRVNGETMKVQKLDVNFPRRSKDPASPAIMTAELDGAEVVCKLKNEIFEREKWSYPLIK
jgi:hypothetical protein